MVTRSWAWRATGRDLGCAATVKTKKPATAGILKSKKPASASSEGAEIPEGAGKGKILEPSELLKLKKDAYAAQGLWQERDDPGALERWIQAEKEAKAAEEAQSEPPKKRKKLVTRRLPDSLITVMKTHSYFLKPIPDQELERMDKMCYGYAETYRMRKFMDDKMYAYEQALINQYDIMGYAEDVKEVTDDEQE